MSKANRIRELQQEVNRLKTELTAKEKQLTEYQHRNHSFVGDFAPKRVAPDTQTGTKKEAKT